MVIYDIPILPKPNQRLSVDLGGQNTKIRLTTRLGKLYADVSVGNREVILSRVCRNKEPIIGERYRGFIGEIFFADLHGNQDPEWKGLGSRYVLRWLSE